MRVDPLRPQWEVRTPAGRVLVAEYDRLRQRWRVTPGGYEARSLRRALAQASGAAEDAAWVEEVCAELERA